jgi:hypothetical protein
MEAKVRKIRKPSTQKVYVGNYSISNRTIDLFAILDSFDGSFALQENGVKTATIEVGFKNKNWRQVFEVVLHEATEFAMSDVGLRFQPAPDFAYENGSYTFHMDHTQFSNICAKVSEFLTLALPDLFKVFDDHKQKTQAKT